MKFSEEEMLLIEKASIKVKQKDYVRVFILIILSIGMAAVLLGWLKHEYFTYVAYFIIFVLITHMGSAPHYDELVKLLLIKSNTE